MGRGGCGEGGGAGRWAGFSQRLPTQILPPPTPTLSPTHAPASPPSLADADTGPSPAGSGASAGGGGGLMLELVLVAANAADAARTVDDATTQRPGDDVNSSIMDDDLNATDRVSFCVGGWEAPDAASPCRALPPYSVAAAPYAVAGYDAQPADRGVTAWLPAATQAWRAVDRAALDRVLPLDDNGDGDAQDPPAPLLPARRDATTPSDDEYEDTWGEKRGLWLKQQGGSRRVHGRPTHRAPPSPPRALPSPRGGRDLVLHDPSLASHLPPRGWAGLVNMDNTCYMNATIQALAHCPPLIAPFLSGAFRGDVNPDNPLGQGGRLATAFASLASKLWAGGVSRVTPAAFRAALVASAPRFGGAFQQDAQELLSFLLDGLHEDLNRVKVRWRESERWKEGCFLFVCFVSFSHPPTPLSTLQSKPYHELRDSAHRTDADVAAEAWAAHAARNDSAVVDSCQGLLRSALECPACGHESKAFDPYMFLSLPLPPPPIKRIHLAVLAGDGGHAPMQVAVDVPGDAPRVEDVTTGVADALSLPPTVTVLLAQLLGYAPPDLFTDPNAILPVDPAVEYVAYTFREEPPPGALPVFAMLKHDLPPLRQPGATFDPPTPVQLPLLVMVEPAGEGWGWDPAAPFGVDWHGGRGGQAFCIEVRPGGPLGVALQTGLGPLRRAAEEARARAAPQPAGGGGGGWRVAARAAAARRHAAGRRRHAPGHAPRGRARRHRSQAAAAPSPLAGQRDPQVCACGEHQGRGGRARAAPSAGLIRAASTQSPVPRFSMRTKKL